ncbi:MAG: roadblock/LC7 domain-containing protein [Pseudomonadota bacterium]
MKLRLVGFENDGAEGAEHLEPEERAELDKVLKDPTIEGLSLMTREGVELRAQGVWSEGAAAVFSNVMRLVDRIGEEFGEQPRHSVFFAELAGYELAVVPLSRCDALIVRRTGGPTGGLSNVG